MVLRVIPELNNRYVRSVACGDFHTLAVVSGTQQKESSSGNYRT